MNQKNAPVGFVVVECDPIVSLDIKDTIMSVYDAVPMMLEQSKLLSDVLASRSCPTVIIASIKKHALTEALRRARKCADDVAIVLIADFQDTLIAEPAKATVVASPFTSDTLLTGIRSAYETLRSGHA